MTAIPGEVLLVAERLADLRESVVFLGGMVRQLLVTDPAVPGARPTVDVDVIVQVTSGVEHAHFEEALRARSFKPDQREDAPVCRYVFGGTLHAPLATVDFMPLSADILGFTNRWYASAFDYATWLETPVGSIRLVDAPHFLATKLESFAGRGQGDYVHHDIEDVVVVVDGRASLLDEVAAAPPPVREFIARSIRELLAKRGFVDALPLHLPSDRISQARLPLLEGRLMALGALAG